MENKETKNEEKKIKNADAQKPSSLKNTVLEYLKVILVTVIVTYAVLYFVQISRVVGDSMNPTYKNGNIVLVNKKFYHYDDVKYGDVVVAKANFGDGEEQIIKRVIGKGGDVLACKRGVMYRNGKKLNETYIKEKMFDDNWQITVKKGCLFCMGDNRNNSADSREIGAVNFKTNIVGKVFFKVF